MPTFLDLPEDIRLAICAYISPEDLLVLKQTCRGLHAFGCMDYVWHQMKLDLPLDLPLDHKVQSLSSQQVQRGIIDALRLDHNWRHEVPYIRQCRMLPVSDDGLILKMQLVTPSYLVCLSRSHISVWDVGHAAHLVASLRTHRVALMFSAAVQVKSEAIIVAVVDYDRDDLPTRRERVKVYTVMLKEDADYIPSLGGLHQCHSYTISESMGTISDVNVCRHIVGVAIAKFSDMTYPPSYEILLIHVGTGVEVLIDPELPHTFERLALVVCPSCIVLVGVEGTTLMVRVYALPSAMRLCKYEELSGPEFGHGSPDSSIIQGHDLLIANLELFRFPSKDFDFHVSAEFRDGISSLSVVTFDTGLRPEKMRGYVFRIPGLMGRDSELAQPRVTIQNFAVGAKTSVDKVCVGKTGRRAVWLQRHWDTDEFDVMRSTFSASSKVGALFPKHLAFPFGPLHTCQSLAFDEATGRVAMSLLTGQLYILDY